MAEWPAADRCRGPWDGASVLSVEQTDALLAARLAAGDDHALPEITVCEAVSSADQF